MQQVNLPVMGSNYQFLGQKEIITYVGRDGCWLQFTLDGDDSGEIWCELLDCDTYMIVEV